MSKIKKIIGYGYKGNPEISKKIYKPKLFFKYTFKDKETINVIYRDINKFISNDNDIYNIGFWTKDNKFYSWNSIVNENNIDFGIKILKLFKHQKWSNFVFRKSNNTKFLSFIKYVINESNELRRDRKLFWTFITALTGVAGTVANIIITCIDKFA